MNDVPSGHQSGLPDQLASRRSMLCGGTLLGLSAATAACASVTGPPRGSHSARLALDYKPSQVTGWSPPASPTLGGHRGFSDFTWLGKTYRVSLLPFGQKGHASNPVYEDKPRDHTVKFKHTLARKWGTYYTFRYLGGVDRSARFAVESYSAFHGKPLNPRRQPGILVGADLYVVYHPARALAIQPSTTICSSSRWSTTRSAQAQATSSSTPTAPTLSMAKVVVSPRSTATRASASLTSSARASTEKPCRRTCL